jgi:phenylpropionate dioxygenase-like ring-hydroxylating dioxygenase large terminal subunit
MINDPILINDWHPILPVANLPPGGVHSVQLLDEDLVIWRAGDEILAWQDLCLHRGTRLSLGCVVDNFLECAYHGWTYNTTGACERIPAHPGQRPPLKAQVKSYRVKVHFGLVWVCLGEPAAEIGLFPEWDQVEFRKLLCGPYPVAASGPRIIENFLDVAHFPFVHEGILGVRDFPEISDYQAEIDDHGVLAQNVQVYQPDPYGTGVPDTVVYTYRAYRPLTAYLAKESAGPRFSILLTITPHAETKSTAWMWLASNTGLEVPDAEVIAYQDEIFAQDRPIVESQRPELLPLDLQAELHLRSDRTAIAYRRWLNDLGLTFGTS